MADPAEEQELNSSWALLIQMTLLCGTLWTSYYLQVHKIRAIHETVVAIFAGMFVGLIIRFSNLKIQEMVTFDHSYFFNLLLPPIILNSAYEMKRENFFRNFGIILTFAFVGTLVSALVTGILVEFLALIHVVSMSFLESMIFGAILSATDPVTILAIFQTLKVDPQLYSYIFGESILNDAVAIVLFETLKEFHGKSFHSLNILHGIGLFLGGFTISLLIGVLFAIVCALMMKYSTISGFPAIESCLIALIAYMSYLFSNGCKMSGIVSLLFCGITLKHYAYDNMSLRTKRTTKYMFRVLAQLSENFIFIYLGLTLFTQTNMVYQPVFIFFASLIICVARYCSVYPLSNVVNAVARYRGKPEPLSAQYQAMLFWAGLRGAVAVALAARLTDDHAPAMKTTVLVVVVLSVIVFGGTTNRMLEILKIQTGVIEDNSSDESDYDDDTKYYDEEGGRRSKRRNQRFFHQQASSNGSIGTNDSNSSVEDDGLLQSRTRQQTSNHGAPHWFISFDDRFLKPLFTRHTRDRHSPESERWRNENLDRRSESLGVIVDSHNVSRRSNFKYEAGDKANASVSASRIEHTSRGAASNGDHVARTRSHSSLNVSESHENTAPSSSSSAGGDLSNSLVLQAFAVRDRSASPSSGRRSRTVTDNDGNVIDEQPLVDLSHP